MEPLKRYHLFSQAKQEWLLAFSVKGFLIRLFISILLVIVLLIFMRYYLQYLEARNGTVLKDWLLERLPSRNFSKYIFGLLYPAIIIGFLYLFTQPFILLRVLQTAVIVYSIRIITLYLIKLDPPEGLIPLVDPVGNALGYGGTLITKDLFFSGHTASLLILLLAVKNPWLKIFFLIVLVAMITMLLWQHVHYTVDILGAFVFAIPAWQITRWRGLSCRRSIN